MRHFVMFFMLPKLRLCLEYKVAFSFLKMNYIIITGTSRGLGAAITNNLIKPDNHLICVSRSNNFELVKKAENENAALDYFNFDLSDVAGIENLVDKIFSKVNQNNISSISLINNAAVLQPVKPIDKCEAQEIIANINVNLTAVMLLVSFFIKKTNGLQVEKRIVNISSGAANSSFFGWSNYCAAKAGLNIFADCVNLEQAEKEYPAKVITVSPGIIDTQMQTEIRAAKKEDFKDVEQFISYKEEGYLQSPDLVAKKVIKLLDKDYVAGEGMINILDIE